MRKHFHLADRSCAIPALAIGLPLLVVMMTTWAFWPSLGNGFVDWDDGINFVDNVSFRGLHWPQVRWAFSNVLMGHYIPVTWLTLSLDYTVWGMEPFGYHLSNVIVHTAAALAFYLVAGRLLGAAIPGGQLPVRLGAAVATIFFAIHPLRVESVAWVTERRDALSTLFALVAVLAYLAAVGATGARRRTLIAGSLTAYVLAVLSKSMVMTLPIVLIIVDVYPLRRLSLRRPGRAEGAVILEKLPYLALGLVAAALAVYGQHANRFFTPLAEVSWTARIALALYSVWFYLSTSMLPFGLSPIYELPHPFDPLAPRFVSAALGAVAVIGAAYVARRRQPAVLAAALAYLVMLAPVSGLAHAGHQVTHDRYSYFPSLPLALLLGAAVASVAQLTARRGIRRPLVFAAAGILGIWLVSLGVLTRYQSLAWRDTETLWSFAIDAEPTCSICQEHLGVDLAKRGQLAPALYHLQRAIALRPDRPGTHHNVGVALLKHRGHPAAVREAITHLETALRMSPRNVESLAAYGAALIEDDRPSDALVPLASALRTNPQHAIAVTNFGAALEKLGDHAGALQHFHRAIAIDPAIVPPRYSLARLHGRRGNRALALVQLEEVRRIDARAAQSLERELREATR